MKKRFPYYEYARHDPTRSAIWRWERAEWLIANHRNFSSLRDDFWVGRAVRFQRAWRRARSARQLAKLDATEPDICAAYGLHTGPWVPRLEIQGRLLARQSVEEVARIMALPIDAVRAYAALFFHVGDRLDCKSWVLKVAIRKRLLEDPRPGDTDIIVKTFAYFGGPVVFEFVFREMLKATPDGQEGLDLSTPAGRLAERMWLAVDAMTLRLDTDNGRDLIWHLPWLQQLDRSAEKDGRFLHYESRFQALFSQAGLLAAERLLPEHLEPSKQTCCDAASASPPGAAREAA